MRHGIGRDAPAASTAKAHEPQQHLSGAEDAPAVAAFGAAAGQSGLGLQLDKICFGTVKATALLRAVRGARELGAPPAQRELGGEGPALREAEEVYAGDGPAAVGVQVLEDGSEQRERRRWVRMGQELAERVEGVIPLVRFFVEVRDPRKFCVESGFCG